MNFYQYVKNAAILVTDQIQKKLTRKLSILGHFLGFFFSSKKSTSLTHNLTWVSDTIPNLEKTNDSISRKRPDRQKN